MLTLQDPSLTMNSTYANDLAIIHHDNYQTKTNQNVIDEDKTSTSRDCFKKTIKFLFSHIGLVVLVVVYVVAGGFLFELLEQHQERINCQEAYGEHLNEMTRLKQQIITYIQYNTTSSTSKVTSTYLMEKDNITVAYEKIASMLYDYRDFIIDIGSKYRYYGDDCTIINKWTFANSLLFAITIITTIGYGNITPMTWEGQICCICYATIGIPIFLLCVANISGVLGQMFRFLYAKVLCRPCFKIKRQRDLARKAKLEEDSGLKVERTSSSTWDRRDDSFKNKSSNDKSKNDIGQDDYALQNDRVTVPLTITMFIIAAYIWIGSVIFHTFEQWTLMQAGYFCFITLATIGFGDFVPGQIKDDPNATAKLILGSIYVLIGMAILAMCFDLMQEEIVAKFRWIGRKIGIVDKDDDSILEQDQKIHNTSNINNANKTRASIESDLTEPNSISTMDGKMVDDKIENSSPIHRYKANARKISPRNNINRVHPSATKSNDGSLYQRTTSSKVD